MTLYEIVVIDVSKLNFLFHWRLRILNQFQHVNICIWFKMYRFLRTGSTVSCCNALPSSSALCALYVMFKILMDIKLSKCFCFRYPSRHHILICRCKYSIAPYRHTWLIEQTTLTPPHFMQKRDCNNKKG